MFILSILAKSRLYFLCGVITVGYLFSLAINQQADFGHILCRQNARILIVL